MGLVIQNPKLRGLVPSEWAFPSGGTNILQWPPSVAESQLWDSDFRKSIINEEKILSVQSHLVHN